MSSGKILVLGGGHNSLVAATYLARAGRSVTLLERQDRLGGTLATDEIAPGFRAPALFPSIELFHPSIRRELELERHGLKLLRPRGGTVGLRRESPHLVLRAPDDADGGLSIADAQALLELDRFLDRLSRTLEPLWTRPLPRLAPLRLGNGLELAAQGLRLRRLGRREMAEALRYLPMTLMDVLDERFEDETLKATLAAPGLTASWLGPRSAGSALGLLHHRPHWAGGLLARPVYAEGGPGGLVAALESAARQAGVELLTSTGVRRIAVDRGRIRGVATDDGSEMSADVVVSGLDPRTTLVGLLEPGWLDPDHAQRLTSLRNRGTVSVISWALDRPPVIEGVDDLSGRLLIGGSLERLERAFDANKYGEVPERPSLELTLPSLTDPELCRDGGQVMTAWIQYTPYRLREGGWNEARDRLVERVESLVAEHVTGFDDSILERRVLTPLDIERRFGCAGGSPYHAEMALDQMLYLRPLPGWSRHRTPIGGLWLCGPGTHPGGGPTGLPGRNAARALLA